jgi:hypothetical protein
MRQSYRDPVFEPHLSSARIDPSLIRGIWAVRANHGHTELPGLTFEDTQFESPSSVFTEVAYLLHVTKSVNLARDLAERITGHGPIGPDDEHLPYVGRAVSAGPTAQRRPRL